MTPRLTAQARREATASLAASGSLIQAQVQEAASASGKITLIVNGQPAEGFAATDEPIFAGDIVWCLPFSYSPDVIRLSPGGPSQGYSIIGKAR